MLGAEKEKEPCWKILDCSKYVYENCPAYLYPDRPCWENTYTQSENLLGIKKDCKDCKVLRLYGNAKGERSCSELDSKSVHAAQGTPVRPPV